MAPLASRPQALSLTLLVQPAELAVVRLPPDAHVPPWAFSPVPGALRIAGSIDFALTGVLASVLAPLGDAGISIFAVSTFDTDYILVREHALADAIDTLRAV